MKRQNICANAMCGKKFGLVAYWKRGNKYCSRVCKRIDNARRTAEVNKRDEWLRFLCS